MNVHLTKIFLSLLAVKLSPLEPSLELYQNELRHVKP